MVVIPATVLVILAVLYAVPFTRYALAGMMVQKDIDLIVQDTSTSKPVSNADVTLGGKYAKTDNQGKIHVRVKPGKHTVRIQKKYYKDYAQDVTVPIGKLGQPYHAQMTATGRQVPVSVTNKITGKPLENALVKVLDTEGKTDKDGKLTLVIPADKAKVEADLSANGYNTGKATVTVTEQETKENAYQLTPSGKVYFLSKKSGKIDVVKTDLDGTNRQVVLAATGKENDTDTVLLAARDWKYLALKAQREGDKAKLYLIDTTTDKLTTIDEGDATFNPVGWYNERFIFTVNRNKKSWETKQQALKSFDAKVGQLKILDETLGEGVPNGYDYAFENINYTYILENEIVYTKTWSMNYNARAAGKSTTINSIRPDGSGKKILHSVALSPTFAYASLDARLYEPGELYFSHYNSENKYVFYEYEDGAFKEAKDVTADIFNKPYPTYLLSPSGKQTFWSESRDGKGTFFVGTAVGDDGQELGALSEYTAYGWYGDDYLLLSKKNSELFIMGKEKGATPQKITDYHKPEFNGRGYGYGYGGL
jgi:hypothetical protein